MKNLFFFVSPRYSYSTPFYYVLSDCRFFGYQWKCDFIQKWWSNNDLKKVNNSTLIIVLSCRYKPAQIKLILINYSSVFKGCCTSCALVKETHTHTWTCRPVRTWLGGVSWGHHFLNWITAYFWSQTFLGGPGDPNINSSIHISQI